MIAFIFFMMFVLSGVLCSELFEQYTVTGKFGTLFFSGFMLVSTVGFLILFMMSAGLWRC